MAPMREAEWMWSKAITSVPFIPYPQGFLFIYLLWQSKEALQSLWHLHVSEDVITQCLDLTHRWVMTMAHTADSFKSKNDNLFSFQIMAVFYTMPHTKMTEKSLWLRTWWALQWSHSSYLKKREKTVQCLVKYPFSSILFQNYFSSLRNV